MAHSSAMKLCPRCGMPYYPAPDASDLCAECTSVIAAAAQVQQSLLLLNFDRVSRYFNRNLDDDVLSN